MIRSNRHRGSALNIFKEMAEDTAERFLPGNSMDGNNNNSKGGVSGKSSTFGFLKAFLSCCLYMVVGPVLILNNKYILKDLDFKYPMFVSCLGLISTSIVSHLLVRVFKTTQLQHKQLVDNRFYLRRIMPVGMALALTLSFGNAVYIHLDVGLIQMLKAFTPVIVLVGVVLAGLEKPSKGVVLSILGIVVGTVLNCAGSTNYTIYGLFLMFAAEAFEAVRLVLTQFLLQNKKFSVIEGQYYLAPASCFCLLALSAMTEWSEILELDKTEIIKSNMPSFFLSATLGLFVNLASFLVVQTTNSVTLKILGTVRNAGLVVFQVIFASEVVTMEQFAAYMITLVAFGAYNYFKMTEPKAVPKASLDKHGADQKV